MTMKVDTFGISIDTRAVERGLKDLHKESKLTIKRTIMGVKSGVNKVVKDSLRVHYNIKPGDVPKPRFKTDGSSTARELLTMQIIYSGRRLTHTHFKLQPGNRPSRGKPVYATVVKGRKSKLKAPGMSAPVFVGPTPNGGIFLPMVRTGAPKKKASKVHYAASPFVNTEREPVAVLRAMSVPQMIQTIGKEPNKYTMPTIKEGLNKLIAKKLEQQMNAAQKRIGK
jgi:hypothetical protein